jgi:putative tryptophan/tyrosine transport system substrate-binding protein
LAAQAQQPERMRRIGVLMNAAAVDSEQQSWLGAFLKALQELGWIDGRNVRIDTRWATTNAEKSANTRQSWSHSRQTSFWHLAPRP